MSELDPKDAQLRVMLLPSATGPAQMAARYTGTVAERAYTIRCIHTAVRQN